MSTSTAADRRDRRRRRHDRPRADRRPSAATTASDRGFPSRAGSSARSSCSSLFIGLWYFMHYWGMRHFFDKPAFLIPSPHEVVDECVRDSRSRAATCSTGSSGRRSSRSVGLAHHDRHRHVAGGADGAGAVGRALALPVPRRPAGDPDPGRSCRSSTPSSAAASTPRLFVCMMISIFPIVTEHPVRAALGRRRPARPVHAARRVALDPAASSCSSRRRCRRSSPASASPPGCR